MAPGKIVATGTAELGRAQQAETLGSLTRTQQPKIPGEIKAKEQESDIRHSSVRAQVAGVAGQSPNHEAGISGQALADASVLHSMQTG